MTIRTTCPYCGVGCGVAVAADGVLTGDAAHPANFGSLCSKGSSLGETLSDRNRLLYPKIGGKRVMWEEATALIARRFARAIAEHGPESVAFYLSGQLLTEDYYVANKLAKGFLGTANVDTNSRLCMASAVAAHVRAFGEDVVPGCYEDLDEADLAVLVGSNMAWCHPILYRRLIASRESRGTKIVVIDPRRTVTCEVADLHLAIKPGSDTVLFNGLLVYLAQNGLLNRDWIGAHTSGFLEALAGARANAPSVQAVAGACEIPVENILKFYALFADTERTVTLTSQGVNQSSGGTDKFNAIINCHLATARIGKPGMGPLSLTGQPNAMGGREVGGLANQLAAHMGFSEIEIDRVGRFWNAERMATKPGLKAVDLFEAVADGRIKALWIQATNPAVSMPRAAAVRDALAKCPFVVVSDCWETDTSKLAHVVLPAAGWGEKNGTVTNSERRISRQRPFRNAPGEAKPDWRAMCDVAKAMGYDRAFGYQNAGDIFREHTRLSTFENSGARLFDLGALATIRDADYEILEPVQWGGQRLFADGRFSTSDSRARFVVTEEAKVASASLLLNTGRVRDQWHTMTRTGRVLRLMHHESEPLLDIHPHTAAQHGLEDGGLARISSGEGGVVVRVRITPNQREGEVFLPMHWTDAFWSSGPAECVVHADVDPVSGQPDLKATAVEVAPVMTHWCGLLLTQPDAVPCLPEQTYWTRVPLESGQCFALRGMAPLSIAAFAQSAIREMLDVEADITTYADPGRTVFRFAALRNDALLACLFLGPTPESIPLREQVSALLGKPCGHNDAMALLAQRRAAAPLRRMLCICHGVSEETVREAIVKHSLTSVAEIGKHVRAGTNCGSCIPELKAVLAALEPVPS